MKILILAEDYSTPDGKVSLHYIHSRNLIYLNNGIDVSVLSFRAEKDYTLDGIKVYTEETYKRKNMNGEKFDTLLLHAPNLKNHLRFLKKYEYNFKNIVFFFHGHEVLRTSEIYPKPYDYNKKNYHIKRIIMGIYDAYKLKVWKNYFGKIAYKSQFIFVSNWMYEMFLKFVDIDPKIIINRKHIIYNCVGEEFESIEYDELINKKYDFITIRSNIDGSKYGIDIVCRIAENNPKYKFCVVGKGEYFKFNESPDNLEWINTNLTHEEIINFLNKSRCALLPTRADAQGVMACEMATFGIPLITSNIDVCKEVFEGFDNVFFIDNSDLNIDMEPIFKNISQIKSRAKNEKYFSKNTVDKEIELFKELKG